VTKKSQINQGIITERHLKTKIKIWKKGFQRVLMRSCVAAYFLKLKKSQPNVGAAGCGLVGAGGVLGLPAHAARSWLGLCPRMNSYYTICIKNVQIGTNIT
jgi:hypothetical protein